MRIRFGEFVLDCDTRELTCGGQPRHLSTKAFRLLELLVRSAPRALTKEELYREIWGDSFVEEVNLPNLISEIRAALCETRRSARFIKTIHGYGYSFSAVEFADRSVPTQVRGQKIYPCSVRWGREEFPLRRGDNLLGRDGADIVIDSAAVSRRHARISVDDSRATIEDLGSKNGTFVRGERIEVVTTLQDGDEVRLGRVALSFRICSNTATTLTQVSTDEW